MASTSLADLLGHHLARSLYSYGQLAELAGLPRRTVANWISGMVARPRSWQDLLRVAHALELNEAETNELLRTAGFGPLTSLRALAQDQKDRHLIGLWIPADLPPVSDPAGAGISIPLLRTYLAALAAEGARLPAFFPPQVPFTFERISQQTHVRAVGSVPAHLAGYFSEQKPQPWLLLSGKLPRVTVIGPGGIGKTHLLRRETVHTAQHALTAWPLREQAEIPLFVRLADLAPLLPDHPHRADSLAATARAAALQVASLRAETVERLLISLMTTATYPLLLLLDGWDEVGGSGQLHTRLAMALVHLRSLPGTRLMLTSRADASYEQAATATLSQVVLEIVPLGIIQVQRFVRSWFYGRRELEWPLRIALRAAPDLAHLASTPLMLTMLAIVAELGQVASASKIDLFNRLLRLILEGRWRVHDLQLPGTRVHAKVRLLQVLAWRLATHAGIWHDHLPAAEVEDLIAHLPVADRLRATWFDSWGAVYGGVLWELTDWDNILYVETPANRSEDPAARVGFLHRSFHVHLVAAYLLSRFEEESQDALEVHYLVTGPLRQLEWLEVLRLLVDQGRVYPEGRAAALLATLLMPVLQSVQSLPGHLAVIVGEMLAANIDLPELAAVSSAIPARLCEVMETGTEGSRVRVYAGRVLGHLGDPRPAVQSVDAVDLVEIPGGPFLQGGDRADSNETDLPDLPLESSTLPRFWLSRYLVTNAQYAQFMQEGYDDPIYWPEANALGIWRAGQILRAEPVPSSEGQLRFRPVWTRTPHSMFWPFELPNHPASGINWFEARAFARWLDARWRRAGRIPAGYHFDLPSETEWEKGARGVDGRLYPWGNDFDPERLNWGGQMLHGPTAVGCFPDGASPYGLLDMAGNLMEWTRTVYHPYDLHGQNMPTVESRIVVRGGAYYSPAESCRCAFRSTAEAIGRLVSSFRVALAPD